jgi:hypothetical protein
MAKWLLFLKTGGASPSPTGVTFAKRKAAKDAEWAGGYRNTCRKVALFIP